MKKLFNTLLITLFLIPTLSTATFCKVTPKASYIKKKGLSSKMNFLEKRQVIAKKQMTKKDFYILELAKKAAKECALQLETAIDNKIKTENEIFAHLYFPIFPLTTPRTFNTFYDDYTDIEITPIEDKYLAKNKSIVFVVLVDINGYLPSHNTKFCKQENKTVSNNRTKRIFNDITGYRAAQNKKEFLLQIYSRDTGEIMADMSVPVYVKGKHWGGLRIGYNRDHIK
jgi:hypothetical protein